MALKDRVIEIAYKLKDQFTGATGKITGSFKKVESASDRNAQKLESNNKRVSGSFLKIGTAIKSLAGLAVGRFFVESTTGTETLIKGLEIVSGSSEAAAKEFDFVKRTANEMGVSVRSAGNAYLSLAAASKGTNLEGEETQKIFTSITRAMGRLGKSGETTELALKAISQMMSKGKVSAEELRGQLGDHLPGALQIAARAMGKNVDELLKMVENGEVLADDLLPKLADELDKTFDNGEAISTFTATWERFKNSIEGAFNAINESAGIMNGFGAVIGWIGSGVSLVSVGFVTLAENIKLTAANIESFFKFISRDISFTEMKRRAAEATKEMEENIQKAADAAFSMDKNLKETTESAEKAADAVGGIGKNAEKAADDLLYIKRNSELTKKEVSALNKQSRELDSTLSKAEKTYERNVKGLNDAKKSAKELREEFAALTKEMRDDGGEDKSPTVLDVQREIDSATQALNQGDEEGALKGARKAGELLRQMKEEGLDTDIVLTGMALRLERLADGIAKVSTGDELIEADKSKAALDELIAKKQKLVEGPLDLRLNIDSSAIDNYKPPEIVIPVRYEVVGGVPTFGDGSINIHEEARKRGTRPR